MLLDNAQTAVAKVVIYHKREDLHQSKSNIKSILNQKIIYNYSHTASNFVIFYNYAIPLDKYLSHKELHCAGFFLKTM